MTARDAHRGTGGGLARRVGALLLAACVVASSAAAAEPVHIDTAAEREREAKIRYDEGVSAYQAGRYQQAITFFLVADELAPRAALAFNVARAYDRLDDSAGALRFYRDYLRRESSPPNLDGVKKRIVELEAALAARGVQQLTVLSEPPGAFVSIDGQPRGPTPWTGELVPGRHELTLLKEGYLVGKRALVLDAAHAADVSVPLQVSGGASPTSPPPVAPPAAAGTALKARPTAVAPAEKGPRFGPWPWITLGAGGAALLAAGGVELARASAEREAQHASTQIDYVDAYNSVQARQTAARVLAGIGGTLVVAGGVLVAIDLTTRSRGPVATAACTTDRCLATLGGTW
jgi:tetratricopeptide (TPR) repeat protein